MKSIQHGVEHANNSTPRPVINSAQFQFKRFLLSLRHIMVKHFDHCYYTQSSSFNTSTIIKMKRLLLNYLTCETLPFWDLNPGPAKDLSMKQMAYKYATLLRFFLESNAKYMFIPKTIFFYLGI